MPITRVSDDEPTLVAMMNHLFDLGATSPAIRVGKTFLAEHHLEFFRTAEANALMATMFLHLNDSLNFLEFRAAMCESEDYLAEHEQVPCKGTTETIRLNLERNFANWLYRKDMFEKAELIMSDKGFKSSWRPVEEGFADELIRYVGRLLHGDAKAATMLEHLFHRAYNARPVNRTYLRNIRYWLVFALCAVGRDKDAGQHALRLIGAEVDPLIGADPKSERRRIVLAMGRLRNTQLRMLAAKYAISRYQLK
jgi:hypothetical protein